MWTHMTPDMPDNEHGHVDSQSPGACVLVSRRPARRDSCPPPPSYLKELESASACRDLLPLTARTSSQHGIRARTQFASTLALEQLERALRVAIVATRLERCLPRSLARSPLRLFGARSSCGRRGTDRCVCVFGGLRNVVITRNAGSKGGATQHGLLDHRRAVSGRVEGQQEAR